MRRLLILLACVLVCVASPVVPGRAISSTTDADPGATFDRVAEILSARYFDPEFRAHALPELIERFRPPAYAAGSRDEEKAVIDEFLSHIPASHLALLSSHSYRLMMAHLTNRAVPTVGFELIELDGKQFVHGLLQGGPAAAAGVRMGDRVVSIDGVDAAASKRLDWSTHDPSLSDPPIRALLVEEGETVMLELERVPGEMHEIEVEVEEYSSFDAARRSAVVYERGEGSEIRRIGYLHLHYVHMQGPDALLAEKLGTDFRECEGLILDLRGRGGNAMMVPRIIRVLINLRARRGTSIVAIIDGNTRSAKEAIAWELRDRNLARLVGETTAGALLPATFVDVGDEAVLMFPAFKLPRYSDLIESRGVEPHIHVEPLRMYTNGDDPLIERALREAVRMIEKQALSDV